jgi:transposase
MLRVGKITLSRGGDLMRFDTTQHPFDCGIDLHARTMYVCILAQSGEVLVHRNMQTDPDTFLHVVAPYRQGLVVAVECMFPWDWLADLCADEGIPFVLGHALYMQAIHGGKATNDKIDSHKIAALLRGGMLPQASVSPARMRATRDLLRRRRHLAHTRAEILAHVQNTNRQYNLPAIGKKSASKANREGVAERFADPAVQKRIEVDLARITSDDALLRDVERTIVNTARHHDANTLHLLQTVPGIGTILRRVLLDELHDVHRFPRVQDCVSSCRLVTCARESAGKRSGTSGTKIGKAHLKWAFSEAAVLFLRDHPAAQKYLARLEKKHDKGKALTILAQKLARAVYHMRTRQVACEREMFFQRSGRGADEPGASLDTQGMNLQKALACALCTASVNAKAPMRSRDPAPCALLGPPLALLFVAALVANGLRRRLLTRAWFSLDNATRCARSLHRTV